MFTQTHTLEVLQAEDTNKCKPFKAWHVAILALIAAAIIFIIQFVMLYADNVWPFSDRVLSQYDLLAQIVPFAEHFFDVFSGQTSIFYSWRLAGGMDVFGTVAYCLISPFSFLFWVFGEGNAWHAAAVMIPAKLSCSALTALVMIKLCFPAMKKPVALTASLLYAYCGYVFVANTYINWMDFLIYLPLAVPAFLRMVKKGKIFWFAFIIACCIYTCFSIACFSMFISYPALVLYAFMVVPKGERKIYLTRLSLAYISGVIAALPLMIPAVIAYARSGRNTGIFDSLWNDISETSYSRKLSYILSDSLFIVLIFIYFIQTKLRTKESRYLAVAGLMVMMPVLVDECCVLMNMGSYMSYALRFGFLNAVYELVVSCIVLEKLSFRRNPEKFGRQLSAVHRQGKAAAVMYAVPARKAVKREKGELTLSFALPFICVFAFLALALYAVAIVYSLTQMYSSSFSSFAHSTGAMEFILYTFAVTALVYVIGATLYVCRLVPSKIIFTGMALVIASQVVMYGGILVDGNIYNHVRYDQYNSLYQQVMENEELESYEFRVKDYGAYISDNQPLFTNSAAYSMFSSVTDYANFAFSNVFGMGGNGVNTIKSRGGNLLGNCIIGNKYYFYNSEEVNGVRPQLTFDFLEEVGRESYFIMYENTLVFPSAYTVSGGEMDVTESYDDYFANMQNIYAFLGGEGSVFEEYTFEEDDVVEKYVDDGSGGEVRVFQLKMHLPVSGDYTFYPHFADGSGIKWYTGTYYLSSLSDLSSVRTFTYANSAPDSYYSIYLVGDNLTAEDIIENCTYVAISKDTVQALSQSLWQRQVKYTMTSTTFTTTITATVTAGEGEYLFINYMALDGHTACVNGRQVQLSENGLGMLLVPLDEGENTVVIEYNSPYLLYIFAGVSVAVAMFVVIGVLFCGKKGKKRLEAVKTPAAVASVALACVVVAFFMVFPTGVFIYKLIFL
ncbi:MAG: YfhO family protein [Clostridia bacterium]|nr:YfhO family protein [Clostridia bacterium]